MSDAVRTWIGLILENGRNTKEETETHIDGKFYIFLGTTSGEIMREVMSRARTYGALFITG